MIKHISGSLVGKYALNSVGALLVIGGVASIVNLPDTDRKWATLSAMLVDWDVKDRLLEISVQVTKRQECHRTVVNKLVRPISEGDIVPEPVAAVNGQLFSEIQAAPIGTKSVFDRARLVAPSAKIPSQAPPVALATGQYMVTMVALCEPPDAHGQLNATDPIQSILIVP